MTELYKIANQYASLANDDSFTPEMIKDTLEAIEGEFEEKAEQLLAIVKNSLAESEMLKAEAKKLNDRSKSALNRVESIKAYLAESMATMDKKSISAGVHNLTIRKGSQSVQVDNLDDIPSDYVDYETVIKPDKNLIKEKLKLGEKIGGVSLVTGKPSVLIK